jgi:IclR family acetate operon transcriptional repressor
MRMFTEVGRRVDVHCTAVGKAILAQLPEETVEQVLARATMKPQTERSITTVDAMRTELGVIRDQGYAVDDGEQEIGVRCLAVAVPGSPSNAAISISGPETRMGLIAVDEVVPLLTRAAKVLAREMDSTRG